MGRDFKLEFKKGCDKEKILKFPNGRSLAKKELDAALSDLNEAKDRFAHERFKYATIIAYYSMFHSVRAMVYAKDYREKSHYYLFVALQYLYVSNSVVPEKLAKLFLDAMVLREEADYHGEFSSKGAELIIDGAVEMFRLAESILSKLFVAP